MIALLVVGPKKLPELAKALGKGLSEFRKVTEEATDTLKETLKTDEIKKDLSDIKDSLLYGKEEEKDASATPAAPDSVVQDMSGHKDSQPYGKSEEKESLAAKPAAPDSAEQEPSRKVNPPPQA